MTGQPMEWRQEETNPIPEMERISLEDPAQRSQQERRRQCPKTRMTWGDVKATTSQALELLRRQDHPETPENLCAAFFAIITANSATTILCLLYCLLPMAIGHPLTSFHQTNIWEQFAAAANVSSFCLGQYLGVGSLLSSCLLPVCKAPGDFLAESGLSPFMNASSIRYSMSADWGPVVQTLPAGALSLVTKTVANHESNTCARIAGATKRGTDPGPFTGSANWNCTHMEDIPPVFGNILLPRGWFWTCGERTFNYIPARLSAGTLCCLSRLTIVLPQAPPQEPGRRRRRSALPFDPSCRSDAVALSKAEFVSLATSLVGVPGLASYNAKTIGRLACALAKSINSTSTALDALASEQQELRQATLDNRAAIDYLLLLHHQGCENVHNMCCFNLSDNSQLIHMKVRELQEVVSNLKYDVLPHWWSALWSWLPGGWLSAIVQLCIGLIVCLVIGSCFVQCVSNIACNVCKKPLEFPLPRNQVLMLHKQLGQLDQTAEETSVPLNHPLAFRSPF